MPTAAAALKKIGDVAVQLGTTTRALRFYEEQGLIEPLRSPKGTRLYSPDDVTRLRVILLLATADVPIQIIKQLSKARSKNKTGDTASKHVARILDQLRKKVQEKKNLYTQLERELGVTHKLVQQCFGCSLKPTHDTCFSCTRVPDFRKAFMVKLIAEQHDSGFHVKRKSRQGD